jgi:hypothetical protein
VPIPLFGRGLEGRAKETPARKQINLPGSILPSGPPRMLMAEKPSLPVVCVRVKAFWSYTLSASNNPQAEKAFMRSNPLSVPRIREKAEKACIVPNCKVRKMKKFP